jgi:hypothetical protein
MQNHSNIQGGLITMSDTPTITLERNSTVEERQIALRHIYAQVLERQPYESERKLLASHEKGFLSGKLGVRHFLQALGNSSIYLDCFFYSRSNLKFLEGCFKHFLGRAPLDKREMEVYVNILMKHGVSKVISEMTGSEEYRKAFGIFTVPHARFMKLSTYMLEFGLTRRAEDAEPKHSMTLEDEAEELVKALQGEENARRIIRNLPPRERTSMRYATKSVR